MLLLIKMSLSQWGYGRQSVTAIEAFIDTATIGEASIRSLEATTINSLALTSTTLFIRDRIIIATNSPVDIKSTFAAVPYTIELPSGPGLSGQVLTTTAGAWYWSTPLTSVAITVPPFLTASAPVTPPGGTLAISLSGTPLPVANGGTGTATSTGTGSVVLGTSPTFTSTISVVNNNITADAGALKIGGDYTTGYFLRIQKGGVAGWGTPTLYNNTRYIVAGGNGEFTKDFNVGPGGVGIGYACPDYSRAGVDAMIVNGRIGIKTTTPSTELEVNGSALAHAMTLSVTPLQPTSGGTGLNAVGSSGQLLASNGTAIIWQTPPSPITNGVAKYSQLGAATNSTSTITSTIATFSGKVLPGQWNVGVNIYASLTTGEEVGEVVALNTPILTSTTNGLGVTTITFQCLAPAPDGSYYTSILPAPEGGRGGSVAANVVTYDGFVPPGTWDVGDIVLGFIDNLTLAPGYRTSFETTIITSLANTPVVGSTRITFACVAPNGNYIINITPAAGELQTWFAYQNIDFATFQRDAAYNRGLELGYTLGNFGRFTNNYAFPVVANISYTVARAITQFFPIPGEIPYSAYVNIALTVANGQTSAWVEANDDGIKLATSAAASSQVIDGSCVLLLDPGEFFQLRGYNNSPLNSGIWESSAVFVFLLKFGE